MKLAAFTRVYSRMLLASSAIWGLLMFLPWYRGESPWTREPQQRFAWLFMGLSVALAALSLPSYPWRNNLVGDIPLHHRVIFWVTVAGGVLWMLAVAFVTIVAIGMS